MEEQEVSLKSNHKFCGTQSGHYTSWRLLWNRRLGPEVEWGAELKTLCFWDAGNWTSCGRIRPNVVVTLPSPPQSLVKTRVCGAPFLCCHLETALRRKPHWEQHDLKRSSFWVSQNIRNIRIYSDRKLKVLQGSHCGGSDISVKVWGLAGSPNSRLFARVCLLFTLWEPDIAIWHSNKASGVCRHGVILRTMWVGLGLVLSSTCHRW